jgi:hypothetical protein
MLSSHSSGKLAYDPVSHTWQRRKFAFGGGYAAATGHPPGVEINKLFRLVRDDVMEATAGRQEPFTYGSLPGKEELFFVER